MTSYLSSLLSLIREFYNRTIYFILGVIDAIATIYLMNQSNKSKKKNKLKSQGAVDSDDIEYVRFYISKRYNLTYRNLFKLLFSQLFSTLINLYYLLYRHFYHEQN
jgi:hypothetical protein